MDKIHYIPKVRLKDIAPGNVLVPYSICKWLHRQVHVYFVLYIS